MNLTAEERFKIASLLRDKPKGVSDYLRIGGRSALEGGIGLPVGLLGGALSAIAMLKIPGFRRAMVQAHRERFGIPPGRRIFYSFDDGFIPGMGLLGAAGGGVTGMAHGAFAANRNANERNQSLASRLSKRSSFLNDKPGVSDYLRIGGRTALEGGVGGYGSAALTSLLLGLISKRFPGAVGPALFGGLTGGAGVAGAMAGGQHGFNAARRNAQERLGPLGKLKRLTGMQ